MIQDRRIFINCPFDQDYWPLMRAMVFAIHACGFKACCAVEEENQIEGRLEKIARLIKGCSFGIHDLSRNGSDPDSGLARFNMPLELGIFLGATFFGIGKQKQKSLLVLDAESHEYHKTISDLKGRELRTHGNDPAIMIRHIRDWLTHQKGVGRLPGGNAFNKLYLQFLADLPEMLEAAELEESEVSKPAQFID